MYRYICSCGLSVKYAGHIAKDDRISILSFVTSWNEIYVSSVIFMIAIYLNTYIFTSICMEHQSISLIMKNLPSPPIFLTIRDKMTCWSTRHSPQSKLFNFWQYNIFSPALLLVSINCEFIFFKKKRYVEILLKIENGVLYFLARICLWNSRNPLLIFYHGFCLQLFSRIWKIRNSSHCG